MENSCTNLCQKETMLKQLKMSENKDEKDKNDSTKSTSYQRENGKETPIIPIGRIYLITNLVNNKRYVGITTRTLQKRWNEHLYDARHRSKRYSILRQAIRKYGESNFRIVLIKEIKNTTSYELQLQEAFYINEYKSFSNENGYNLIKHSESNLIISDITKKKMSENATGINNPFFGKHHTNESKKKMGGAVIDYSGNKNPFYGKTHTEMAKQKSREYNKKYQTGKNHPRFGKEFSTSSRLKMSNSHKGKQAGSKNPAFDSKIRQFQNLITKEIFQGTQFEFKNQFKLNSPSVSSLCKHRILSHKNWIIKDA